MATHKCIYCLQIKDEVEFNSEHVVPQMMGKYDNGFVLSNFQVCKECNSFFDKQMENNISLDSYEAFLRMQYRYTPMSDGRSLKGNRIRLIGDEGIFKGMPFRVVTDKSSPYRILFNFEPMVGIISSIEKQEYNYYLLENLPTATEEVMNRIKESAQPIVNSGIDRERLDSALIEKGYLVGQYTYFEKPVLDLYEKSELTSAMKMKIDPILRRVCAKTVFNYLCFSRGKEFVFDSSFNAIREYIRYGKYSDQLWFCYSSVPALTVEMPNDTAHVVGYMWYRENGHWIFCGLLTWFGHITYIFKLGDTNVKVEMIDQLDTTKMAFFNNVDRTITENEAIHVYEVIDE